MRGFLFFIFRDGKVSLRAFGAGLVFSFGQVACAPRGRAGGAGQVFFFGQMAMRSARARGRAGFFFKLVLALVARGGFYSFGQMACAPRGPEVEPFFL